jgi:putative membrane protein
MIMVNWLVNVLPVCLLAQAATSDVADVDVMRWSFMLRQIVLTVIFSLIGVAVMALCVWILDALTPFSFRKEILEDQNTALAIVVGLGMLGISIIIAAAIHG